MSKPARVYGGIDAAQRAAERRQKFLDAGLEILGADSNTATLTVRGVCKQAGLVARYFYESFADGDALVVAVYEDVIQSIVVTTLAALGEAPEDEREQIRIGLSTIIGQIAEDPRRGRLLFGTAAVHPALVQKRLEMSRMFADLLADQAQAHYGVEQKPSLDAVSRFLVGGFGETLTAWQHGDLDLSQDALVDLCIDLFLSSASVLLAREGPTTGGSVTG